MLTAHKKELVIIGISTATLIAIVLGIKNKEGLEEVWWQLQRSIKDLNQISKAAKQQIGNEGIKPETIVFQKTGTVKVPHNVNEHIRNLHEGWKASSDKVIAAAEHGFDLKEGQTWVKEYRTGLSAAA